MLPSYRTAGEATPAKIQAHIRPIPCAPPRAPLPRRARRELWNACWQGREPAESLPTADREDLVYYLVNAGWTDQQIALHTRMTVYTTVRIRQRLELPANAHLDAA